jgi:hypothetical protein
MGQLLAWRLHERSTALKPSTRGKLLAWRLYAHSTAKRTGTSQKVKKRTGPGMTFEVLKRLKLFLENPSTPSPGTHAVVIRHPQYMHAYMPACF